MTIETTKLVCPECSRDDFGTPHGLGSHRRRAHGVIGSARSGAYRRPSRKCRVKTKQNANPEVSLSYQLKALLAAVERLEEENRLYRRENERLTRIVGGMERVLKTEAVSKMAKGYGYVNGRDPA